MSDVTSKIQQLEALRLTFGDAWIDAQIAALRSDNLANQQQITAQTANNNLQVTTGSTALVLRDITIMAGGKLEIHGQSPEQTPAPEALAQAMATYLRTLLERYQFLNLQGMGASGTQQTRIMLRSVFIDVQTDARIEGLERLISSGDTLPSSRRGDQPALVTQLAAVLNGRLASPEVHRWLHELCSADELALLGAPPQAIRHEQAERRRDQGLGPLLAKLQAPRTALELIRHERALVLLGDPGSGKTTVLRHVTLGFAYARLYADQAESQLDPELAWTGPLPLPILVQLRRLAHDLQAPPNDAGPLLAHLQHVLTNDRLSSLAYHLEEQLEQGAVVVLLDGLDEIADDQRRAWVAHAAALFQSRFPQSRVVVTSRIYAYRELCVLPPPFRVVTLQPLAPAAADDFIHRWYRAALLKGSDLALHEQGLAAAERARQLTDALDRHPRLRDVATNPLLLTMICLVDQHRVRLPQQRAELYKSCLLLLLEPWEERRADGTQGGLARELGIPNQTDRLALLQPIAYELQVCGREEATHQEVQRWLLERFLDLSQDDRTRARTLISQFLDFLEGRSGLLIARDIRNRYAFPHKTFQEYLAARELAASEQLESVVVTQRHAATWREVILLVVGHQVSSGYARQSQSLIWALLEADPKASDGGYRSAILAGDMIEELGSVLGREGKKLKEEVITELVALVQQGRLSAKERVEAALLLGRLGDPRLPRPEQDDYWCAVTPGTFWYGNDGNDLGDTQRQGRGKLQCKQLAYGFKIARFPVTNAEYAAFIVAGGYTHEAWWTPEGWRWRLPGGHADSWEHNERPISGPRLGQESSFNAPMQPVVGISWYEAAAYSNWLTAQGHAQGWLPVEAAIRLPTSLEWEYAARGGDSQRRYPWGDDEPTPEHANYAATGIGRPTPVGCFSLGRSPCGAEDLAGNVMEWMATAANAREETAARRDFELYERVLLSRSDYSDQKGSLFCCSRFESEPDNFWYLDLGFRVVWSLYAH